MTNNSIAQLCEQYRRERKGVLVAFTTFGYPTIPKTFETIQIFQDSGVDILELGVPFSDPLADGPVIQNSSMVALRNNVTLPLLLGLLEKRKKTITMPIALLSYLNPVFRMGPAHFFRRAEGIVDALGTADLPVDDASEYCALARAHAVATVFFVTSTTADARARAIGALTTGFVYYVSASGITGTAAEWPRSTLSHIHRLREMAQRPLLAGFGITSPAAVKKICMVADGAIVGTAIIQKIAAAHKTSQFRKELGRFLRTLTDAAHTAGKTR